MLSASSVPRFDSQTPTRFLTELAAEGFPEATGRTFDAVARLGADISGTRTDVALAAQRPVKPLQAPNCSRFFGELLVLLLRSMRGSPCRRALEELSRRSPELLLDEQLLVGAPIPWQRRGVLPARYSTMSMLVRVLTRQLPELWKGEDGCDGDPAPVGEENRMARRTSPEVGTGSLEGCSAADRTLGDSAGERLSGLRTELFSCRPSVGAPERGGVSGTEM